MKSGSPPVTYTFSLTLIGFAQSRRAVVFVSFGLLWSRSQNQWAGYSGCLASGGSMRLCMFPRPLPRHLFEIDCLVLVSAAFHGLTVMYLAVRRAAFLCQRGARGGPLNGKLATTSEGFPQYNKLGSVRHECELHGVMTS